MISQECHRIQIFKTVRSGVFSITLPLKKGALKYPYLSFIYFIGNNGRYSEFVIEY